MATILIVDDREDNRKYLVSILSYCGHRVLEAGDGAVALQAAREGHPDLVITDIHMPQMDGGDVVKQLRADEGTAKTPIIIYSATCTPREAEAMAHESGADMCLSKPAEPEEILRVVNQFLNVAQTPIELPQRFLQDERRLLVDRLCRKIEQLEAEMAQRRQTEEALRASEEQLAADLDAMTRLQKVGTLFVQRGEQQPVLDEVLQAAVSITNADMGSLQLLDSASGCLRIVAQRGFEKPFLDFWNTTQMGEGACGTAIKGGHRVLIEDVTQSPIFAGKPALDVMLAAGARAVQSTLLRSRTGRLLGIFSTHFKTPRRPDDRALRLLDLLALQTADILESAGALASLVANERRFRALIENSADGIALLSWDGRILFDSPSGERMTGYAVGENHGKPFFEFIHAEDLDRVRSHFADLIAGRTIREPIAVRFQHKDGSWRWLEAIGTNLLTDPAVEAIVVNYRDITERKKSEAALHASQERLGFLIRTTPAVIYTAKPSGDFEATYISENVTNQTGHTPGDFVTDAAFWSRNLHPHDAPRVLSEFEHIAERGELVTEYRFRFKDGSYHWIQDISQLVRDQHGEPLEVVGSWWDITKRKRTEEALVEAHARLVAILNSMFPFVGLLSLDGIVLEVNHPPLEAAGLRRNDVIGKPCAETYWYSYSPAVQAELHHALSRAARGETVRYDVPIRVAADRFITIDLMLGPLRDAGGNVVQIVGSAVDITRRKQAEKALRESEERFRLFIEHAPASLAMFDREMRYIAVSNRWLADRGLAPAGIIGKSHYEVFSEIPERWKAVHRRGLAGEVVRADEDRFERADGRVQWLCWEVRPWHAADGTIGGIVIFTEDITERKQAEEAIREAHLQTRTLIEESPLAIIMIDAHGIVESWNSAAQALFGWTAEEVMGRPIPIVPEEDRTIIAKLISDEMQGEVRKGLETRRLRKDGTLVEVALWTAPFLDATGRTVATIRMFADITERKRAEDELSISREQLAALTRLLLHAQEAERRALARELHDELGQVLTLVKMNIQAARRAAETAGKQRLDVALEVTEQAIAKVRSLSVNLRPPVLDDFGLKAALEWLVDRQAASGGPAIELAGNLGEVRFAAELETACFRVVQEAITNALRHAQAKRVRVRAEWTADALVVSVRDDGIGFDLGAVRNRAAQGGSTGLLSMEERVRLIGGDFRITTAPGLGAEVCASISVSKTNQ